MTVKRPPDDFHRMVNQIWPIPPSDVFRDTHLVRRAKAALRDSLARLDALPRDDPFWVGTNGRTTITKLAEFIPRLLRDNPNDEQVLRYVAALDLSGGSNWFGAPAWIGLSRLGRLHVRWPIYAAHYVWASSGVDTSRALAAVLQAHGPSGAAEMELRRLCAAPDSLRWLSDVMRCLGHE